MNPTFKLGLDKVNIDTKFFSPDQLAKYKAKGLDIQGMAEREEQSQRASGG